MRTPGTDVNKCWGVPKPLLDEDVCAALPGEDGGQLSPAKAPHQGHQPRQQPHQQTRRPGAHTHQDPVGRDEDPGPDDGPCHEGGGST